MKCRRFYAEAAIDCWQAVIDRKGLSRFPLAEARVLQLEAVGMLDEADLSGESAVSCQRADGGREKMDFEMDTEMML